jgi:hypothetical protein
MAANTAVASSLICASIRARTTEFAVMISSSRRMSYSPIPESSEGLRYSITTALAQP